MSSSTPIAPGAEPQDSALISANVKSGTRLLASGVVFLFMAFGFAFFYLRALNSNHDFHPAGVNPPVGYGVAILVCVLVAAGVFSGARAGLRLGFEVSSRSASFGGLALGVAVVALQIVEYVELPFKTTAGGFASVFWGWTLVFLLCWLGAVYWMETLVAQTLRSSGESSEIWRASASACAIFLYTLAGVEIVGYVLLYLVK